MFNFSEKVKKAFNSQFGNVKLEQMDRQKLKSFIDEHFDPPGSELEECELTGWKPYPKKIMKIKDKVLREWALVLHNKWKKLCRKVSIVSESKKSLD